MSSSPSIATTNALAVASLPTQVIVHPLVLLSVVDHYNRVIGPPHLATSVHEENGRVKRVVGVLLGQWQANGQVVNVTNSFAVPFDEDEKNPQVWFLDHNYLENMSDLFKKVNAKERILGWYHTGPKMRSSDITVNELFKKKYVAHHPVLVVIDVEPKAHGIPTEAYVAIEELRDGKTSSWTFAHVASMIDAEEAEEIGVEHLLRDLRDHSLALVQQQSGGASQPKAKGAGVHRHIGETALSNVPLSLKLNTMISSLKSFAMQLQSIQLYLGKVASGLYPPNMSILALLQDVFNLMPDLDHQQDWRQAHIIHSNDQMAIVYLSSLVRTILSLHSLINNKIDNREEEKRLDDTLSADKPPVPPPSAVEATTPAAS